MIGHMLEHETTLSIINKIEILLSNISDHNIMKVEINCKLKVKKKKKKMEAKKYATKQQIYH